MGLTTEGGFYFIGVKNLVGRSNLAIAFFPISSPHALDQVPIWACFAYEASYDALEWTIYTNTLFSLSCSVAKRRSYNFALTARSSFILLPLLQGVTASSSFTQASTIDGTYLDYPFIVGYGATGGAYDTLIGRVADLAVCPTSYTYLPNGSISPLSGGPTDSCRIGHVWLPANAAISLL
jgi:hypothetical protein